MNPFSKAAALAVALLTAGCADSERSNPVTLEAEPLVPKVAPPEQALTFAQVRNAEGKVATLLVTGLEGQDVRAIDLTGLGAPLDADVFDVITAVGDARLASALKDGTPATAYPLATLLPSGAVANRHLASGTNFPEHAKETSSSEVFNFPKFGPPGPPVSTVALNPGVLLDYEVEVCVRFDRDLRSAADFDAARKAFFLCGDFTDRAKLMRLVDPKHVTSGLGFSDAKSGPDFFPTGPFVVVPKDWKAFVKDERILTKINGKTRQDARAGQMSLDFRQLLEKALTNGGGGHYNYKGKPETLLVNNTLQRGAALMSGTPEGVIFMPPTKGQIAAGVTSWVFTGPMFRGEPTGKSVVETFIASETKAGRYLKVGDVVEHASSSMGQLRVNVVEGR